MEQQLSMRTRILDMQSNYFYRKARELLGEAATDADVRAYATEYLTSFYQRVGGPLLQVRLAESGHVPMKEEFEAMMEEIVEDLGILYAETEAGSTFLKDTFNYAQSERKRLLAQVSGLNALVGDLNLIAHENKGGNLYFKESFESKDIIDEGYVVDGVEKAQVSAKEGILTLARKDTVNLSTSATVQKVEGNGTPGTAHVARRIQVTDAKKNVETVNVFIDENEELRNDQVSSLLDFRPDTIFEYQMVNVPNEFIKKHRGYDFEWVKGNKEGELLRLRLVIELAEESDINWLNINPYYPVNSTGRVKVYSVKTSVDGFDFRGLYDDEGFILNTELNETPQTYRLDDLFDGSNEYEKAKFTGQGVWSFPTRRARYIEIVFDQDQSYEELIGQAVYYKRTTSESGVSISTQIPEPMELKDRPAAKDYVLSGYRDAKIDKVVEATKGWRYVIGLRDINIMSYRFAEKSMYVSKRFEVEGDIARVMLYVNEKIPASFLERIETSNEWIKYEVSFDDVNWYRISPMHHEPVTESFAPKIIELNGNELELESAFQVHKTYVTTREAVDGVRLRISMMRPPGDGSADATPIVEDYALRVVKREDLV